MHSAEMIGEPKTIKKSAFAKLINVSPGRVSQMLKEGMPEDPDGRIDIARAKLWISEHISPVRSAAQSSQGDLPFAAELSAAQERARLVREQADQVSLRNQKERGELIPAAEVERAWSGVLRQVRAGILAVPSRLRHALPHLTTDDIAEIDFELRRVLEELARAE